MGGSGKKLLYLESLRGIAAFIVVLCHTAAAFFPVLNGGIGLPQHSAFDYWIYITPVAVLFSGNFSVCVFFVLSGFVLTYGFFQTGRVEILARGALKRYVRLMPPVLASVLLAYVLLKLGLASNQATARLTGSVWLASLWQHVTPNILTAINQGTYQSFAGPDNNLTDYNPVLWTMGVEFLGSLLVFGMAAILRQFPRRVWIYLMLIALNWNNYFLAFIIGMALADLISIESVRLIISRITWPIPASLLGLGLILGGYPSTGATVPGTFYSFFPFPAFVNAGQAVELYHILGAVIIVAGVLAWSRAQRLLSIRPLVALGRQSFSLYLTHLLILGTFSCYLFNSLIISRGYTLSFLITLAVSLALMISVSYLFTRWIDQPSIALAQLVAKGRKKRSTDLPLAPIPGKSLPTRFGAVNAP